MSNTISSISKILDKSQSSSRFTSSKHILTSVKPTIEHYGLTNKNPSIVSVDHHPLSSNSDDTLNQRRRALDSSSSTSNNVMSSNGRLCSLTQMLLLYAQKEEHILLNLTETHSDNTLNNILNVLELHFNAYADDKRQIYFESIFQILHDFKEQITEYVLIETMQLLQIDPLASFTFETFILILCHLPPIKQDRHVFLDVFNELDHNNDSYITFEDIHFVLPHLTFHLDEEIIRAAIHTIDTDHDNDRLSYFDFVTSLIALEECKLTMKTKTAIGASHESTKRNDKAFKLQV